MCATNIMLKILSGIYWCNKVFEPHLMFSATSSQIRFCFLPRGYLAMTGDTVMLATIRDVNKARGSGRGEQLSGPVSVLPCSKQATAQSTEYLSKI